MALFRVHLAGGAGDDADIFILDARPVQREQKQPVQMQRFRNRRERCRIDDLEIIRLDPVDGRMMDTCLCGKVAETHAKLQALLFVDLSEGFVVVHSHLTSLLSMSSNTV